ncbi:MAG: very short patch repair endonuclease [Acidimicrobiales bacterium]
MAERWRQPFASSEAVRRRMSTQRREGTAPELAVRRAVHALGLRYRVHAAPVPGLRRKADLVFGPSKVAVFVDGCFWHGCPEHGQRSHAVNGWYWPEKIARNRERDEETDRLLTDAGWLVVRIWEHEVDAGQASLASIAVKLASAVESRRLSAQRSGRRAAG